VSEKERSLSLAHVLTKIASKLGVAIEFDLTLEGGYLQMIGVFENLLPDLIPLADMKLLHSSSSHMKLHHKAVAAMEARKNERIDRIRKVIGKWRHTNLAEAFETFRNIIKVRKRNRLLISKIVGRWGHVNVATAFETFRKNIKERKHNRLIISKVIKIQKAPLLHAAFGTWVQQAQVCVCMYVYTYIRIYI
jgi:hypothetical protein